MATKSVSSRLKANSQTNDSNGYDILGHLMDAGIFASTGQMPIRQVDAPVDDLDRQIKMQRLQTTNPDFQMKLAQTKADIAAQQALELEDAKVRAAQERYKQATAGQSSTSQSIGPNLPQSPIGQMSGGKVPMFISQPKYNASLGMMIDEPIQNPEYLGPKDRAKAQAEQEQQAAKNELVRSEGISQLQALRGARKGLSFFGPMGGELPSTLMGFPNPAVGTSYPGNSKISDRTDWEANLENLKAQKMLDTMMKMKEASKTGATGFGQLSEKEGQVLRDASMKLRRNLDPQQAKVYIDQMEALQMKALGMPLSQEQLIILEQINNGNIIEPSSNTAGIKSYGSPEEADANEAPGTIVMVQGRRYQV